MAFSALFARARRAAMPHDAFRLVVALLVVFFSIQAFAARRHANDYHDDLAFWDATRHACPRSAKAHLNYSVMQGARGNLEIRLEANRVALALAPDWPMASIYLGDTLCRLHRPEEAWPYYAHGFDLAPADSNLIALGVQCLWDEKALGDGSPLRAQLEELGETHHGSWLAYIANDLAINGEAFKGVDPKYRPRGYNEGPKGE
jgi:tetratricopeptide (TPR) repeat protein